MVLRWRGGLLSGGRQHVRRSVERQREPLLMMRAALIAVLLVASSAAADEPIVFGPISVPSPVRLGAGVTGTRQADGYLVTCEPSNVEVLRLREQLRLRTAELLVTRGQLDAALRRRSAR